MKRNYQDGKKIFSRYSTCETIGRWRQFSEMTETKIEILTPVSPWRRSTGADHPCKLGPPAPLQQCPCLFFPAAPSVLFRSQQEIWDGHTVDTKR